ncbi:hypothetical protein FD29_GL001619 [Companilactobacillus mindensis DSM 14500]|uniref:Insertion element IS150 protein InsJ-like helix-turn-helix domain-containing protein n=1 Tax=Companilactobacillus mindensis DSM 14500 TaxID=1423770 RepID=A0A0R1QDF9_9LACO|nr:helix-turn-helix domain-containing protein [Companilactobacillus mindensis]KRL42749.1 hypothetical protein FD29_GL001619 [Companilactobacillus mindensis DSM 14500]GEO79066.1 DNA-binding protein [Companilactobacillus mindensis]
MTKYSVDFKLKIVKENEQGVKIADLSKKYTINSSSIINWIERYEKYGLEGLRIRSSGYDYDGKFKLKVLEWKKVNQATHSQTALKFDISNPGTIANWQKKFNLLGPEVLLSRQSRIPENKSKIVQLEKLKRENRALLIENKYLKKIQALTQKQVIWN